MQRSLSTLVSYGADPNARDMMGVTPALAAAIMGERTLFEELVKLGADPLARDCHGRSAHELAQRRSYHDMASWLLEQYPQIATNPSPGRSPSPSP